MISTRYDLHRWITEHCISDWDQQDIDMFCDVMHRDPNRPPYDTHALSVWLDSLPDAAFQQISCEYTTRCPVDDSCPPIYVRHVNFDSEDNAEICKALAIASHICDVHDRLLQIYGSDKPTSCEHDWHKFGTVNGITEYACQSCGETRRD